MHGIEIFQFIKLSRELFDLKPVSCEGHGGFNLLDLELEKLGHVRVLSSIIKASFYCSSTSHRCRMGDPGKKPAK